MASSDAGASVQVVVRLRPMNKKEQQGNTLPVVTASTEKKEVTVIKGAGARQQRTTYAFDNVFTSFSTQQEVSSCPDLFSCDQMRHGQTPGGSNFARILYSPFLFLGNIANRIQD